MIERPVHIGRVHYELGEEAHDIDELESVPVGVRTHLRQAGVAGYRVTERSVVDIATGPLRAVIEAHDPEELAEVRRVVFATNSLTDPALAAPLRLSEVLVALGLGATFPVGMFLSYCANFHSAVDVACALIRSGAERRVIVVCADVYPSRVERLVEPRVSVHSDAAAAFVVSADEDAYRLTANTLRVDAALGFVNRRRDFIQYMDGVGRNVVATVDEALRAAGAARDDVAAVMPNNYNTWVCRSMAQLAGFDESQLFLDNIGRFAHALASDNAINLVDAHLGGRVGKGDVVALMGSGAFQWGCSILEVLHPHATGGPVTPGDRS